VTKLEFLEPYISGYSNLIAVLKRTAWAFLQVSVEKFDLMILRTREDNMFTVLVKELYGPEDQISVESDCLSYGTIATLAQILHACLYGKYKIHVALEDKYALGITTDRSLCAVIVEEELLDYKNLAVDVESRTEEDDNS